jgi:GNAT superfamily N-acetyltransferase
MHRGGLDLRSATLEDASAVAALLHRCFCTFSAFAPPGWEPPTIAWQTADFDRRLRGVAVRARVAVAPDSGQTVAICGWTPARAEADPGEADPSIDRATGEPRPSIDHATGDAGEEPREPIPGLAHLWLLFVAPEHWGNGLAGGLLAWAQAGMIDVAYDAARLWTPAGQARARAFYERRGWRPSGREHFSKELGLPLVEYRVELG